MRRVFIITGLGLCPPDVFLHCSVSSPQIPVMTGEDIDVPWIVLYVLVGQVEYWLVPLATMSGFTRPSRVGPRELKPAILRAEVTAPTETTFFALARTPTVRNGPYVGCFVVSQSCS